jgi:hypothetical protein
MSLRQRASTANPLLELLERFLQQRRQAKLRGIPWQLDYWEWLEIWQTSGHLHERRHRGEFQMCRLGDIGAYRSSNVRIDRMETNAAEAQVTKRRLRLERQSLYGGATARHSPSTIICSS